MANCETCVYRKALDTATSIVEGHPNLLNAARKVAKLRELGVLREIFEQMPEQPACDSLRRDDDHPYKCPKAGFFGDVRSFIFGNPDVEISGKTSGETVGFGTNNGHNATND